MLLNELIDLGKKKKKKEKKIVFVETNPQEPFPHDTVTALEKGINKWAKDLEKNWKSPKELVDFVFDDLEVPKPGIFLKSRWDQYLSLLKLAVSELTDARGLKADWSSI